MRAGMITDSLLGVPLPQPADRPPPERPNHRLGHIDTPQPAATGQFDNKNILGYDSRVEIGSDFELPLGQLFARRVATQANYRPDNTHFYATTGRSCIQLILDQLNLPVGSEILLPAYLFEGLLSPFKTRAMVLKFYKLNRDLTIDIADLRSKINVNTKILYVIHYFGIPQPVARLNWIREEFPSCCIIEDLAQALGTYIMGDSIGKFADFAFFNFIKFLPVPDGALLTDNTGNPALRQPPLKLRQLIYVCDRYIAMNLKYLYLKTNLVPKSLFRAMFRFAANLKEEHPFTAGISLVSRRLLKSVDFQQMVNTRLNNYRYLSANWRSPLFVPLHDIAPPNVCPLGFLVLCERRDLAVRALSKEGIYCAVHWSPNATGFECFSPRITEKEFPLSREIANRIMMFPIDQRYGIPEMNYILSKVDRMNSYL
jgi:dTDP-4-amino-4,6-dideoxygalactose transaminase